MKRPTKAERTAQELLTKHGLENEVPIPVEKLVDAADVELRLEPLDGSLSGLLYRDDDGHAIIGVNSSHPSVRRRFTIAHELGHLQMHPDSLFVDGLIRRDSTSSVGIDLKEIEANAFAAELLMPRASVLSRAEELIPVGGATDAGKFTRSLAKVFEVSEQAMEYRLVNLGIRTSF